jgi:ubiquinone/menaquinone biosynthesis C-methylase UbiE
MPSNFNRIALVYDLLVRGVFGQKLWHAQAHFLHHIKPGEKVLILGGGTGRILPWLPVGCQLTYVEASANMIERAAKRGSAHFIQQDFLAYLTDEKFDWVICPFFLDCFDESALQEVLLRIRRLLGRGGQLLVTDFRWTGHWHHRVLIRLMIQFFKLTTNLSISTLQPIQLQLLALGFRPIHSGLFSSGLIFSEIYISRSSEFAIPKQNRRFYEPTPII